MAEPDEKQKRLPSQEGLLFEYVRRLEQHRDGRKILHLHLSSLRPFNRRAYHLWAAADSFEPLISEMQAQLFSLKNSDMFLVYKTENHPQVETTARQVRFLFSDDPLVAEETENQPFATWYDATADYESVLRLVQSMAQAEQKRQSVVRERMDARGALKAKQEQGEPLTPEVLARVETALVRADLSNLVRRQFVCHVDQNMVPTQLFSELFISIKDLRETLLPGVNLVANRWLFQHLTETLDRRMLSMLVKTDSISISGEISFNINIATVLSKEFQTFDDNIAASRRGQMVIEFQKEDIFSNLSSYLFAREFVQEKGYRVCLDGIALDTIQMINRERLGVDMTKLLWGPELVDGGEEVHDVIRDVISKDGPEKIIMNRCDTREAIDFGRSVGINLFQGRYVENLIAEDGRRRELLRLKRRIERN